MAVLGMAATAALAGCGGSSGSASTGGGSGSAVQHPKSLIGVSGQNEAFAISMTDQDGNALTNVAAGTYQLTVHDDSAIHNFHLTGGSIDDATTVPETATKTFTVKLTPGNYSFVCDAHVSQMNGSFTVS
jgi:plastocyanin